MKTAKIILIVLSAGFILFGLVGLLAPAGLVGALDIELQSAQSRTEIRAVYGGMSIGIGLFLGIGALQHLWARPALAAAGLICAGLASARLLGIQMEGGAFPWMLPVAMMELGIVAACLWGWISIRSDEHKITQGNSNSR